jgi:probable F420-dependent oxidoreductase
MHFGYVVPNSWGVPDLRDVVDLGRQAEQLGADSLWVSHHVLHVGFVRERLGTKPYHDPLVTLTLLAAATNRVRIGTSVMVLSYVHPVTTAKTLAVIDDLSGGRVVYGVGAGALKVEQSAIGIVPFTQRGAWTDESIDVARDLWKPGISDFHGRWIDYSDVESYPTPRSGTIPIFVGGTSDAAVRRAVTRGDGWHGIGTDVARASEMVVKVRAAADEVDRPLDGFELHFRLHNDIADDDPSAWAERVAEYELAGITEIVLAPQSGDVALHRKWLDKVAPAIVAG